MAISNAERNRRKRERKKKQREEQRQQEENEKQELEKKKTENHDSSVKVKSEEVEIEYVPEEPLFPLNTSTESKNDGGSSNANPADGGETKSNDNTDEDNGDDMSAILRRFHERSAVLISDDDTESTNKESSTAITKKEKSRDDDSGSDSDDSDASSTTPTISKRKQRELSRPTIAQLKTSVMRSDLVEAHDVTAPDPHFLLHLKSIPGTVPVPRHWGRKRKYLQGKRGIEKAPFQLPDFIAKTGISNVRASLDEDESGKSAKQKNRGRVAPKMGGLDVDYRTLHDAFFKHQNRESIRVKLGKIGDLYYEGKEFEMLKMNHDGPGGGGGKIGGPLSEQLREALGMTAENSPPPWLINMQRYGPPPSYPNLKIPGLNAPLPETSCSYGYHLNGWGKPPVDAYGRPLYGGNPFDPPGSSGITSTADWDFDATSGAIVTSDGKTIGRKPWGSLPMAAIDLEDDEEEESSSDEEDSDEDSSSGEEMAESDEEEEGEEKEERTPIIPGVEDGSTTALDLRKDAGTETPAPESKQLYTVLQQTSADKEKQTGAVFTSDVAYVVPGGGKGTVPEGAESVLSKAVSTDPSGKRKRNNTDGAQEDEGELGKKFKF